MDTQYNGKQVYFWEQAPAHLQTYTQLKAAHLKPADRKQPEAYLWIHKEYVPLYDQAQTSPRRQLTEEQKQARLATLQKTLEKFTCQRCGAIPSNLAATRYFTPGACRTCRDHLDAAEWASTWLSSPDNAAIIDTETTGLYGLPVEIAVVDLTGQALFHSVVNPGQSCEPEAQEIHGITDEEIAAAPTLAQIWPDLVKALKGKTTLLAYNVAFDQYIMVQAARAAGQKRLPQQWECIMLQYAAFVGEWNDYHGDYRWQKLNGGHRALGDALAALDVLKEMARDNQA